MADSGRKTASAISEGKHPNESDWFEAGSNRQFRALESQQ